MIRKVSIVAVLAVLALALSGCTQAVLYPALVVTELQTFCPSHGQIAYAWGKLENRSDQFHSDVVLRLIFKDPHTRRILGEATAHTEFIPPRRTWEFTASLAGFYRVCPIAEIGSVLSRTH